MLFFQILGFALFIFWLLLIARVVVEFIRSFSRDWHPTGVTVVILEIILSITDPPVKLLRRLIPQLTIGAVRFDLSIMVLLLVAFIGMQLAFGAARESAELSDGLATVWPRFDARDLQILRIGILWLLVFEIGSYLLH